MLVDDSAREHQAREIELELIRVRSAAEAARLESLAAELELMLRRMGRGVDLSAAGVIHSSLPVDSQTTLGAAGPGSASPDSWSKRLALLQSRHAAEKIEPVDAVNVPAQVYASVEPQPSSINFASNAAPVSRANPTDFWKPKLPSIDDHPNVANEQQVWSRVDSGSASFPSSHVKERSFIDTDLNYQIDEPEIATGKTQDPGGESGGSKAAVSGAIAASNQGGWPEPAEVSLAPVVAPKLSESDRPFAIPKASLDRKTTIPIPRIEAVSDGSEEQPARRFRPASLLVSTLTHVAVLVFLGLMTLASNPPKDQLAFTSSVSESSEESVETFEIESSEPTEPTEPVSETAYEVSEVGTMAIAEVSLDAPPALATPSTSDLFSSSSSSLSSSAMKSLKGDASAKTQFCGVDGGGNHFVYLVDSSGSMGDGFQSARDELLASIDQLKPDQRFYVVFFDEEPAFMRLSDPNVDESASVMATPENKKRLRTWAMTVQMNKGKAPYEILPFALSLRPDVIFLLSDGEFPARIEEILREQNHEENLFGESGPISIVHTIRYHGVEGQVGQKAEATMVKIAKENGGQYRHVPKPKT